MGKLLSSMLNPQREEDRIPLIEDIACVIPASHAIVCSVCDWGGMALSSI